MAKADLIVRHILRRMRRRSTIIMRSTFT